MSQLKLNGSQSTLMKNSSVVIYSVSMEEEQNGSVLWNCQVRLHDELFVGYPAHTAVGTSKQQRVGYQEYILGKREHAIREIQKDDLCYHRIIGI